MMISLRDKGTFLMQQHEKNSRPNQQGGKLHEKAERDNRQQPQNNPRDPNQKQGPSQTWKSISY